MITETDIQEAIFAAFRRTEETNPALELVMGTEEFRVVALIEYEAGGYIYDPVRNRYMGTNVVIEPSRKGWEVLTVEEYETQKKE